MTNDNYTLLLNTWLSTWMSNLKPAFSKESPRATLTRLYEYIAQKGGGVAVLGDDDTVFRLRVADNIDGQATFVNMAWFGLDANGKAYVELASEITEHQFMLVFQIVMLCGSAVASDAFIEFSRNRPATIAVRAMGKQG